jgi:hypothetical protein
MLKGQVFINYEMSLKMSQYKTIFGGAFSVLGLSLSHKSWLKWHMLNEATGNTETKADD